MKCLINQPAGLGDIIFCQKIADYFINKGYEIIWPVIEEYCEIVNKHIPRKEINFCMESDDFPYKEYFNQNLIRPDKINQNDIYLPIRYADRIFPSMPIMRTKFKIFNIDCGDWANYFFMKRDYEKENDLFYNILGLRDDEKFAVLNRNYGTKTTGSLIKQFQVKTKNKIIDMKFIDGYSIFDWCKTLEKSSEIYSVDTSLFYIVEKLNLDGVDLHAYSRNSPPSYYHIEGLFSAPWKYHYV